MSSAPITKSETKAASPKKIFQQLVDSETFKTQIAMALPKHLTPDRFIRVLMTATIKNPKLLECTQESLFKGIFDCAAVGLEIDGRRAHLVPYKNNRKQCMEAQLIVDYKGLAELAMRSGVVSNIHADLVCENDEFEYDRGELKKHKIDYRKDRGEPYAAYSIIRMKDGGEKVEVMSRPEIERVRARSKSGSDGPWVTDEGEMWKKTVFKRASKWVPLSSELRAVIESEDSSEPVNVTPQRRGLAEMLDGPSESETQPTDTPKAVEYTNEQRVEFLDALENYILDAGVTEKSVRAEVEAAGVALNADLSLTEQPTSVLDQVAKYLAAKAAGGTVKQEVA